MYINPIIAKYAHKRGVTVYIKYAEDMNKHYNFFKELRSDQEIAKFFGLSTRAYRKKLREYGAEEKAVDGFLKRLYFTRIDDANKFMDEYLSALILSRKMA